MATPLQRESAHEPEHRSLAWLISPEGPWNKVWLAAHWDKKLKKEDYCAVNIKESVKNFLSHSLTLRSLGHLLLGLCKIHAKRSALHDEHASQVHESMMLAFSHNQDTEAEPRKRGARTREARIAALEVTEEGLAVDEELERLLSSRKHLAPMDEITLKPPAESDSLVLAKRSDNDTFGAISPAERAGLISLGNQVQQFFSFGGFEPLEPPQTLHPLVDFMGIEHQNDKPLVDDVDPQGPLDMELEQPPLAEDVNVDLVVEDAGVPVPPEGAEVPAPAIDMPPAGFGGAGDEPAGKRRKRGFMFDDPVEIPKEIYQGYINDRSAITKTEEYDTAIMLPHNHPLMPQFTTTHSDMCRSLIQCLAWGSQVAERQRAALAMAEAAAGVVPEIHPLSAFREPAVPALAPVEPRIPPAVNLADPAGPPIFLDMSDAPSNMRLVVSGSMDQEDQSANAEARVGYSGRTEKMHKFLATEFQRSDALADSLSYEQMCRQQSGGDRGVIAGCFFELLVLRTNGVVNLRQEVPFADVQIEKTQAWSTR